MQSNTIKLSYKTLLEEKSLFQVWRKSWRIGQRKINWVVTFLTMLLVIIGTFPPVEYQVVTTQIRAVADLGLTFSITILGFLIAGFTIFATLSRVEMFIDMAKRIEPTTQLDFLKYNFFAFIGVFTEYLAFTFLCLMVKLLCFPGGPATLFLNCINPPLDFRHRLAQAALVILSGFLVYVLMQLKSFLFNIYHVVMTSIAWSVHDEE